MAEKKIIIIGAGIAGLAAGCYAQMNGFRSHIFEMSYQPGGLCTAWTRKAYTFDGCIHYLFGSGPGLPFNQVWRELGAVAEQAFVNHEELVRIQSPAGKTLIAYADPDELEAHLCALSPADGRLARELAEGVRQFLEFDMAALQQKPKSLMTLRDWQKLGQKMLPYVGPLARWGMVSAVEFATRCEDRFLRCAIPHIFGNWPEIPMMVGLSLLASLHTRNAGYPLGGSLAFARAIEARYLPPTAGRRFSTCSAAGLSTGRLSEPTAATFLSTPSCKSRWESIEISRPSLTG